MGHSPQGKVLLFQRTIPTWQPADSDQLWQPVPHRYTGRHRCSTDVVPVRKAHPVKRIIRFTLKVLLGLILLSALLVLTVRFVNPPVWGWQLHRALFNPPGYPARTQHQWVDMSQIAKPMQLAVIAAEDQRFPSHYGLDFEAIEAAIDHNAKGRRVRGASTITQQTAKNLFLWPSRSFARKGVEAGFALLLELIVGKQRILELYLNIVEFGPGIYGVEAASRHFYGKPARQLGWTESARLAAVLPNPWRYRAHPPSSYVAERSQWISQQMGQLGYVTLNQL